MALTDPTAGLLPNMQQQQSPPAMTGGNGGDDGTAMQVEENDGISSQSGKTSPSKPSPSQADRRDLPKFLMKSVESSFPVGKNLSNAALHRLFKEAKKDFGSRKQSIVIPNMNLKRTHSNGSIENTEQPESPTDWRQPRKVVRKSMLSSINTGNHYLNDNNRFSPLASATQHAAFEHNTQPSTSFDSEKDGRSSLPSRRPPNTRCTYSAPRRETAKAAGEDGHGLPAPQESSATATTRRGRPPPFLIEGTTLRQILAVLGEKLSKGDFTVRQTSPVTLTLSVNKPEDHAVVKKLLAANDIKFITYTPKGEKPKNLILKGISGGFTADEVKADLDALNIPQLTISKVTVAPYNHRSENAAHFLVQLSPESNPQALTRCKHVLHQKVYWGKLQKPAVSQCINCMQLGHSSVNCNLKFRCGRCKEDHPKGDCKISKEVTDKSTLYCVNCEEMGHAASYRGCPFLILAKGVKNREAAARRNERQARFDQVASRTRQGSSQRPHLGMDTPPVVNAWSSKPNSGTHLFSNSPSCNPGTDTFMSDLEARIAKAVQSQLSSLVTLARQNAAKIDFLFQNLNFYDGSS